MCRAENLRVSDLVSLLEHKGIVVKNIRKKVFLNSLLTYLDNGNITFKENIGDVDYTNEILTLNNRIRDLEEDINSQTLHLNRSRKSLESYQTLAVETEESLNSKINEQSDTIKQLTLLIDKKATLHCENCQSFQDIITDLSSNIELKKLELADQITEASKLKSKISNLQDLLNNRQNSSISTTLLSNSPIPQVKSVQLLQPQSSTSNTTAPVASRNIQKSSSQPPNCKNSSTLSDPSISQPLFQNSSPTPLKRRLLLVADSQGRNCGKIMRELLDPTVFKSLSFFMPNANFEDISHSACNLAGDFNKRDYVILLAGTNNALKNKLISTSFLQHTEKKLAHTNLIVILTPPLYGNLHSNSTILSNNMTLFSVFKKGSFIVDSCSILSRTDYTLSGIHINHTGKIKLLTHIGKIITSAINKSPDLSAPELFR